MCRKLIETILTSISIICLTLCTQTVRSNKYSKQYRDINYPDYYFGQKPEYSNVPDYYQQPGEYYDYDQDEYDKRIVDLKEPDKFINFAMMQIHDLSQNPRYLREEGRQGGKNDALAEEKVDTGRRKNVNTRRKIIKSNDQVGLKISAQKCGETRFRGQRIVGGKNATEGAYPWVVIILKNGEDQCVGSIMSERWILTAAGCFMDEPPEDSTWSIKVGTINRNMGTIYRIGKIIIHERFNSYGMMNADIALMKTTKPIKMSKLVRPVCLPENSYEEPHKSKVIVVGWGALNFDNDDLPVILQQVTLNVIPKVECAKKYQQKQYVIYMSQMCTWTYKKDACQGDSGGPAIEFINGIAYLVGITSYGGTCADSWPGVYTEVSYFLKWILMTIKANE